jgi:hypothetical protein
MIKIRMSEDQDHVLIAWHSDAVGDQFDSYVVNSNARPAATRVIRGAVEILYRARRFNLVPGNRARLQGQYRVRVIVAPAVMTQTYFKGDLASIAGIEYLRAVREELQVASQQEILSARPGPDEIEIDVQ